MATPNLVPTLKSQHQAVIALAGQVNEALGKKDVAAIQKHLSVLGGALLGHLDIEDTELYPALIKAAQDSGQDNLATTARLFSSNMAFISRALKDFLGRYGGKPTFDLKQFGDDWKNIVASLSARINAEETTLYPMYEKAFSSKSAVKGAVLAEKR